MTIRPIKTGRRERGAVLLIMVLLLVIGVASVGLTLYTPALMPQQQRVDRTADALASVKQALVGYASQRGVATPCSNPDILSQCATELTERPGELPCPDTNNDGIAEASCANARLGRVPWKTLGIPEPKDDAGETLWYAVALPFLGTASNPVRVNGSGRVYSGMINSNTVGNIEVRASDGSLVTQQAVAVIFAPGVAINGQNRSANPQNKASCMPGDPVDFRNLCRTNYLESTAAYSNASLTGPYVDGINSPTFNDRLIYLAAADIIPIVEMRVGTELKNLLVAYIQGSSCHCLPWADSWGYSGGIADVSVNRGRFPAAQVQPVDWGVNDANNDIPALPNWIVLNDWNNIVFYSAGRQSTDQSGQNCFFCSSNLALTVLANDQPGSPSESVNGLIFTPGLPRKGRLANASPADLVLAANAAAANDMRGYLDDPLNYNKYVPGVSACPGWDTENASSLPPWSDRPSSVPASCDTYVRPSSRAFDRDRLFTVTLTQCSTDAFALLKSAPCKDLHDPTKVSAVCASIVASLQTCGMCKDAALALAVAPCLNTLSSSLCDAPVALLKICTK